MKKLKLSLTKKRIGLKDKWLAVSLIVAIEVIFGAVVWMRTKPIVQDGFIVKVGRQYIVMWKDMNQTPGVKVTASLDEAVSYAGKELQLKVGQNGMSPHPLEHLWMKSGLGEYTLYWKTFKVPFLNQLTFNSESEAKYYEKTFKEGGYSPSPIGHAITLVPIHKN